MESYRDYRRNNSKRINGDSVVSDIQIIGVSEGNLAGAQDTLSLSRKRSNTGSSDSGIPNIRISDACDDKGGNSNSESHMRRKSSGGFMMSKDNDEVKKLPWWRRSSVPDVKRTVWDKADRGKEEDLSPAEFVLPDLQDYITSQRDRTDDNEKQSSQTKFTSVTVLQPKSRTPRGSTSTPIPGRERRRSMNDISFNIQPRKSITEMTPRMQAQIAKFENLACLELKSPDSTQTEEEANRRNSSTMSDASTYRMRRSSRDHILDYDRTDRMTSIKDEAFHSRRSSTREEASDTDRKSSVRDEVPDPNKRSLTKDSDSDQRMPSAADEITYLNRCRSSIKDGHFDNDRRWTPAKRSSATDEAICYSCRKSSVRDENISIEQRRHSLKENLPAMGRRPSLKAKIHEIEKNWLISEDIDALERRLSIQEPEIEPKPETELEFKPDIEPESKREPEGETEGKGKEPESPESQGTTPYALQVRRFSDLLTEDDYLDDEELEEQFRKSMMPYLKYRRSISELEPYLQYQDEITQMTPEMKSQMEINEQFSGNELTDLMSQHSFRSDQETDEISKNPKEIKSNEPSDGLNKETLRYLVRRFSSEPIPEHKLLQPSISPWQDESILKAPPDLEEPTSQLTAAGITSPLEVTVGLEEKSKAREETEPTEKLEDQLFIDASANGKGSWTNAGLPTEPEARSARSSPAELEERSPRRSLTISLTGPEAHSPKGPARECLVQDEQEIVIQKDQRRRSSTTTFFDFVARRLSSQVVHDVDAVPQQQNLYELSTESQELGPKGNENKIKMYQMCDREYSREEGTNERMKRSEDDEEEQEKEEKEEQRKEEKDEMSFTIDSLGHRKKDLGTEWKDSNVQNRGWRQTSEERNSLKTGHDSSFKEHRGFPKDSSTGLEVHSPRSSSVRLEDRSSRGLMEELDDSPAGQETHSLMDSFAELEPHSLRGLSAELEVCLSRESSQEESPAELVVLETLAPRASSAGQENRSPRGSSVELDDISLSDSLRRLEATSPRGSLGEPEYKSPKDLSARLVNPQWNSSAETFSRSPVGTLVEERNTAKKSSAFTEILSPWGLSSDVDVPASEKLNAALPVPGPQEVTVNKEPLILSGMEMFRYSAHRFSGTEEFTDYLAQKDESKEDEDSASPPELYKTPSGKDMHITKNNILPPGTAHSSSFIGDEVGVSGESDSDLEVMWTVNEDVEEASSADELQESSRRSGVYVVDDASPSYHVEPLTLEKAEQKESDPSISVGFGIVDSLHRLSGDGEETNIEVRSLEDNTSSRLKSPSGRSDAGLCSSRIGSEVVRTESKKVLKSDTEEWNGMWVIKKINGIAPPGVTNFNFTDDLELDMVTEYYQLDLDTGDMYRYEMPDVYSALHHHFFAILGGETFDVIDLELDPASLDSVKPFNMEDSPQLKSLGRQLMDSVGRLHGSRGWTTMKNYNWDRKKKSLDDISAVTFCGCGFLGVYLVGAAMYMQQHTPNILRGRLGGSSVGSLIATCLACDVPLEMVRESIIETAKASREYRFGVFNPFFPLEEPLLRRLLDLMPEDAHIRASGRLYLSLTHASTLTNEVVWEYETRDELVRAVLCCCFLPGLSGFSVPTFQGRRYIDGGMSNNMPLKGPSTLSINAFAGEFDICPEERNSYGPTTAFNQTLDMCTQNLRMFYEALLPPCDLDVYFDSGYNDAKKYFTDF